MKDSLTLVILAAGMGSRFGGLKQIEPIGPNNEFIIDYSVYDAINAGFNKIVFVIKRENYEIFKNTIGKRLESNNKVSIDYAFQELDDLPKSYTLPCDRVKPWGTAHAIYAARNNIEGDFAIINADDFYGKEAYATLANFFKENKNNKKETYCIVGYKAINTMTENGSVKRGVCMTNNDYLTNIIESKLEMENNQIVAYPLDGRDEFILDSDALVSMNMIGFNKNILNYIEEEFPRFLDSNKDNILKCEYLIPDVIFKEMNEGKVDVKVIKTDAKWYGVTYKEDKESVVKAIKNLVDEGIYPNNLWK